ncbi:MAG: RecX family transcriptional regulator [Clostridia bacterium]|nr:RecX family transcriptional regulator [Clostridia bacterium]
MGKYLGRTHGAVDRAFYNRTLAMLARHGYSSDIARKAIAMVARGEDPEEEYDDSAEPVLYTPKKR